ncbi:hypothetical protein [Aquitalea magnusonii]|uniref:Uncharacterized protein n=1 Tax=Aquitalea magnusonii TaxID=332411 RepID=A0A318JIS5_9NEIS|nr:hypothetical protein [Aquitalea magnusonii]PXX48996.1 hypothetical protein DFR38_10532 [Aquitalea magnusonii]
MSLSFALYYDAARTQPVTQLALAGINDTLASPLQQRLYVGPAAGVRTMSTDGQPIRLSVVSTGDVQPAAFRLALTQADLSSAVPGADLALAAQLDDLVAIWLQVDCAGLSTGSHAGLTISSSEVKEVSL